MSDECQNKKGGSLAREKGGHVPSPTPMRCGILDSACARQRYPRRLEAICVGSSVPVTLSKSNERDERYAEIDEG